LVMHAYPSSLQLALQHLQGGLPKERAAKYAQQLSEALAQLHEEGITHGNIKPANLLLSEGDEVIITDFCESASVSDAWAEASLSSYASPEECLGSNVGLESDVWSFGAVLLEMSTGKPPFHGVSHADLLTSLMLRKAVAVAHNNPFKMLLDECFVYDKHARITAKSAFDMLSEDYQVKCCICLGSFRSSNGASCAGPLPHFMCFECFSIHVRICCEQGHMEADFFQGPSSPIQARSPPGAVPCPCFLHSSCSDGHMPESSIQAAIANSKDVSIRNVYVSAKNRAAAKFRAVETQHPLT
jgi:serine/threonine protein kinase